MGGCLLSLDESGCKELYDAAAKTERRLQRSPAVCMEDTNLLHTLANFCTEAATSAA